MSDPPGESTLAVGPMGTWELCLDSDTIVPARALDRVFGLEHRRERPLADYLDMVHPDDRPLAEKVLRDPPPHFQLEWRVYPRGSRDCRWLAVQGESLWDDDGRVCGVRGAIAEISSLREAERLLQERSADLEARVRELNCLYDVSSLVQQHDGLDALLERVVQKIPSGFARSDTVSVRLTWTGRDFRTEGFSPGAAVISHELQPEGRVEVHRAGAHGAEGFSVEEEALLRALSKPISRAIERKRFLQALRESEDRWRTMTDSLAEGVVLYDSEARMQAWNGSAERLLGCLLVRGQSVGCVEGRAIRQDGSRFPRSEYPVLVSLSTGAACEGVVLGLRQDGDGVTWLSFNSRPLFHEGEEKPYGVVLSFGDITERKETEETIRREVEAKELERSRLDTVLETLPVAVHIADAGGRVQQVNAAVEELWGRAPLPAGPGEYHHCYPARWPETGEPVQAHEWGLARSIEHGEIVAGEEMEIERADGTQRTILNYSLPFRDSEGRIAGGVGVSVDISERKGSEGERALLAAIVQAFPDAIISIDPGGRITFWNEGAERMYGYRADEVLGKNLAMLMPVEVQDELEMLREAIGRGEGVTYFDSIRVGKNGRRVDVSVAMMPITDAAGRVLGGAKIDRDISERKRMEQRLQHDALHDRLTGVANRSLFMDRLGHVVSRAERYGERYAVCVLDMDNFKLINDTFGHQTGDELLRAFVDRIHRLLRPVDTLARIGGDEFTLLLEEVNDRESVEEIVGRILEALRQPFPLEGQDVTIGTSIGVMLSDPDCRSADEAVRDADVAVYEAKRQGKNQYVVFDTRMRGEEAARLHLEAELRQALEDADFAVQYQPIMDLRTGGAVGCEALARWQHATMGRVSPSRFINVAEETGLITELGRLVMEKACAALADWRERPGFPDDFYVSVNMSPKEFYAWDLVPFIRSTLERHGLKGSNLRLEITEHVVIQHDDEAASVLQELQAMGVRTCLDDFGTGYSSLGYLHRLPFDVIKVDRSFVQSLPGNPQSREVVRSILALARALDVQAIAEGAETSRQLAEIQALGFHWGQGFQLHWPMDGEALWRLVNGASGGDRG